MNPYEFIGPLETSIAMPKNTIYHLTKVSTACLTFYYTSDVTSVLLEATYKCFNVEVINVSNLSDLKIQLEV